MSASYCLQLGILSAHTGGAVGRAGMIIETFKDWSFYNSFKNCVNADQLADTVLSHSESITIMNNRVVCLMGFTDLRTSNLASQVRKIVQNFHYTQSNSCGKVQKRPHLFFCTRLCKSLSLVRYSFPDYLDQLKCEPNQGEFSVFFLQLVEVILETLANPGETLTQSCAEKYEGFLHFIA